MDQPQLDQHHTLSTHTEQSRPFPSLYRISPSAQSIALPQSPGSYPLPPLPFVPAPMPADNKSVPSPSADPAAVDFRTFYPYVPNEVKHRKRTSRAQLKVLEEVFRQDTKPNAALRKKLAKQLDMSARGVQVWFQNRRAKEKIQAKKASTAGQSSGLLAADRDFTFADDSPYTSSGTDVGANGYDSPKSITNGRDVFDRPFLDTSTIRCHSDGCVSWQPSPSESSPSVGIVAPVLEPAQVLAPRRESLSPHRRVLPTSYGAVPLSYPGPLARRRSVDNTLHRLATHPYAQLAVSKNNVIYNSSRRPSSQTRLSIQVQNQCPEMVQQAPYDSHRPMLSHRASLPHCLGSVVSRPPMPLEERDRRFSTHGISASPSPSPTSLQFGDLKHSRLYSLLPCAMPSPIPGPLPEPGFSFGASSSGSPTASPYPVENECDLSEALSLLNSYPYAERPDDVKGAATSALYLSRFGSIASLAGSESSNASSYVSDMGPPGLELEVRPSSWSVSASSCGNSPLNAQGSPIGHVDIPLRPDASPQQDCDHADNLSRVIYPHSAPVTDMTSGHGFFSPASTASPTASPHSLEGSPGLPISQSTETMLTFQNDERQIKSSSVYAREESLPTQGQDHADSPSLSFMYSQLHPDAGHVDTHLECPKTYSYDSDVDAYTMTSHSLGLSSFSDPDVMLSNDGPFHQPSDLAQAVCAAFSRSPSDCLAFEENPQGCFVPYS